MAQGSHTCRHIPRFAAKGLLCAERAPVTLPLQAEPLGLSLSVTPTELQPRLETQQPNNPTDKQPNAAEDTVSARAAA